MVMTKLRFETVDEYMMSLPVKERTVLQKLRKTIKSAAPKAEEIISYQMPAYKYFGRLVYFAAFTHHCSFFPGKKMVIETFKDELKNYKTSVGTIQFTVDKPLPAS